METQNTVDTKIKRFRETIIRRKGGVTLDISHPDIAKQWHPSKNGEKDPSHYTSGSDQSIWWRCPYTCNEGCFHDYQASIGNRANNGSGCPYCSRKKVCIHQSIVHTHPEIAKEWHPSKNGDITPDKIAYGSKKKSWWQCPIKCPEGCLHEYECAPLNRCGVNKQNCPYCCNQKICIHQSIAHTHPEIAKEWHPSKNGEKVPSQYSRGNTTEKFWWVCKKGHEWQAIIKNRCLCNSGCPGCKHKTESILFSYLLSYYSDTKQHIRSLCPGSEYDFEIPSFNCILELDGPHHFKAVSNWKRSVSENQDCDIQKMKYAIERGYRIIRILQEDVYKSDNVWLDTHLKPHIEKGEAITYICPGNNTIYDSHKTLYDSPSS